MIALISFFCLSLLIYGGYEASRAGETRVLVIEDLETARILWECQVKEGDEIIYEYIHSVYLDKVYETYKVRPTSFIMVKIASSPHVLFSFYPGFGLSPSLGEKSANGIEVKTNIEQANLVIAVGDEVTHKKLTVGERSVVLRQITGHGGGVRIYVRSKN